jgi:S-adenosylmethionine decarboxylase
MVGSFLVRLVERIAMRILAGPLIARQPVNGTRNDNAGLSAIILLHESHAAIHTYPLRRQAFVDVFSCRTFETESVIGVFSDCFGHHLVAEKTIRDRGRHWNRGTAPELETWLSSRPQ